MAVLIVVEVDRRPVLIAVGDRVAVGVGHAWERLGYALLEAVRQAVAVAVRVRVEHNGRRTAAAVIAAAVIAGAVTVVGRGRVRADRRRELFGRVRLAELGGEDAQAEA